MEKQIKNLMLTLRLSPALYNKLARISERLQISQSSVTRLALLDFIERHKNKQYLDQ